MRLRLSVVVLALIGVALFGIRLATAQEDIGGAGEGKDETLMDDGTVFINETGTLVSAPPPPDYKGKPMYVHVFLDSKNRMLRILPSEILERLQRQVLKDEKGATKVFIVDEQKYRDLAEDEVLILRVDRGIVSRYDKTNYILMLDAAYKIERKPKGAVGLEDKDKDKDKGKDKDKSKNKKEGGPKKGDDGGPDF